MRPTADELIAKEIARQDEMWGKSNERADVSHGELMRAGMAQLGALWARQVGGKNAFETAPGIYRLTGTASGTTARTSPTSWSPSLPAPGDQAQAERRRELRAHVAQARSGAARLAGHA